MPTSQDHSPFRQDAPAQRRRNPRTRAAGRVYARDCRNRQGKGTRGPRCRAGKAGAAARRREKGRARCRRGTGGRPGRRSSQTGSQGHPAGHDPAERGPRHQLRADGLRQGRRHVDQHIGRRTRREHAVPRLLRAGCDADRPAGRGHGLRCACQADAHQLRHRHRARRRRQTLDPVRDRLLRLGHGQPAGHEHLCAGPAPRVRAVARMAGRTDLVELPGCRGAARRRGLHRLDRRHGVRAAAAGPLHEGRTLARRREPADHHDAVRWPVRSQLDRLDRREPTTVPSRT